jgi:hypothetical protein
MRTSHLYWVFLFATATALFGVTPPTTRAAAPKDDPPGPAKDVTYTMPKGWRAAESSPFAIAKFQVGPADQAGTVTISALPGTGGGLAANISRWRNQVGLEPLEEAEVLKTTREMKVDGMRGHVVDMTGPAKDGKAAQRILGVIVTKGDQVWFFKMMGPAKVVGNQKDAFDEFVKSVRFRKS